MPCNSTIAVSVEFGQGTDSGLLLAALRRLNQGPVRLEDGSIRFANGIYDAKSKRLGLALRGWQSQTETVNAIKRAYSYEVVMSAVRKSGGSATADRADQNVVHVSLARRGE